MHSAKFMDLPQFILRDRYLFGIVLCQLSNQKQTYNVLDCERYQGMYDELQRTK